MDGMVGSRIAHYQIRRQVGEGGMGVVYEATDERDGQRVAIKVMRAEYTRSREALTRFFNEARATNLVEHSAMVRIHEHGQVADGTAYLAMEFLEGDTLSARLRRYRGPMPEAEARRISWQLASGLTAAHKKSIVHRDLKPGNIMLVPDSNLSSLERVKLLDFGIAKLDTVGLNLENPLTRTGALMGTPHYMSPEQCRGARSVDDRADVYSLGVILFQMLTGRLPFIGDGGDGTVMAMHIYEQPPRPRDLVPAISEPMQDLILQMLGKQSEGRPSMLAIMHRLEELGAAVGLTSDLSVTFEEARETVPGEEPATVMRLPAGAGSAASTLMMSSAAHLATPSQPSSPSHPSTLGPVTGQVGTITRYRRPLVAGVAGTVGIIGAMILAVMALRHPAPQSVLIKTARSTSVPAAAPPSPDDPASPAVQPAAPSDPGPAATTGTDSAGPKVHTPSPVRSKNRKANKRHLVKHKPKGKSAHGSKSLIRSKSVSVVD